MSKIKGELANAIHDEIRDAVMLPSVSKHCTAICLKHIISIYEKYQIDDPQTLEEIKETFNQIKKPFTV